MRSGQAAQVLEERRHLARSPRSASRTHPRVDEWAGIFCIARPASGLGGERVLLRSQVVNPVFEILPETRVRGSVGGETARRGLTEMCFSRRRRVCHRFWMMGRNMQTSAELRREPPAPRPALPTGTRPDWTMGETGFFCESPLPVSALLAEASRGGPPGGWCAARCPVYAWLAGWPAGGPSASMCRYSGLPTMIGRDGFEGRLQETDLQPPMARDLPLSC